MALFPLSGFLRGFLARSRRFRDKKKSSFLNWTRSGAMLSSWMGTDETLIDIPAADFTIVEQRGQVLPGMHPLGLGPQQSLDSDRDARRRALRRL